MQAMIQHIRCISISNAITGHCHILSMCLAFRLGTVHVAHASQEGFCKRLSSREKGGEEGALGGCCKQNYTDRVLPALNRWSGPSHSMC